MNIVQKSGYSCFERCSRSFFVTHALQTSARREMQRARLILCAEAAIAATGLGGLRARDLAQGAGCSVGAIYNLVVDLDELVLLVSQRTMAALDAHLERAATATSSADDLLAWALAYRRFATDNRNLWRALFEFRLPAGKALPAWFEAEQLGLFARLEDRLAALEPGVGQAVLARRARILFSAVHGIVALGIEEKLVALPASAIDAELASFVRTYLKGLAALKGARSST
jgi:AcrR family transcriptional regulator